MSNWKQALDNPFGDVTPCIPDDHTLLSGKLRTRTVYSFIPVTQNGASTNTNSSGLIIRPRPYNHIIRCAQTAPGSTLLRDISSSGGALDNTYNATASAGFWPASTGSVMLRCVAMGVTITYQGTELNRAGKYTAGLIPVTKPSVTSGVTAQLSSLSTMVPTDSVVAASIDVIRNSMQQSVTQRVSDADFKIVWRPAGVPSYQRAGATPPLTQISGGGSSIECEFINNHGQDGQETGSMNLFILLENDYVTTAASAGNQYQVRVDAHWEVVPDQQFGVVYSLSPSSYSPAQLAAALNSIDRKTVLFTSGTSFRAPRAKRAKGYAPVAAGSIPIKYVPAPSYRKPISVVPASIGKSPGESSSGYASRVAKFAAATGAMGAAGGGAAAYAFNRVNQARWRQHNEL